MKYEICNAGSLSGKVYDTFSEAVTAIENLGYVDIYVTATVCAGTDENGQEVYANAHYFVDRDDLPENWEELDEHALLDDIYGYGNEPCILPRA